MKKILTRSISGLIYVLLVVTAIYSNKWFGEIAGTWIITLFFFIIGLIGTHEIIKNLEIKGKKTNTPFAYICAILTFLGISIGETMCPQRESLLLLVPAIAMLSQLWRHDDNPIETIGYTLLPSFWVMMPLGLLCAIHFAFIGLTMMLFILIWTNDTFAYLTGMLLGKHKMWERHSPGKTWEGTFGGLVFCIIAAMLVGPMLENSVVFNESIGKFEWLVIALTCSILGTLGDLTESMFKRFCGVKDSGNIMPGHGGVLDRFDSILMVTPFIAVIMMFL